MLRHEIELAISVMKEEIEQHKNDPPDSSWREICEEDLVEYIKELEYELDHYEEMCDHHHLRQNADKIWSCNRCGTTNLTEEQIKKAWSWAMPTTKRDEELKKLFGNE